MGSADGPLEEARRRRGVRSPKAVRPAAAAPTPPPPTPSDPDPAPDRGDAWEPPEPAQEQSARPRKRFNFIDSREFLAGDYRPQWLVPRMLVKGQPAVVAGPSKGMKTSLVVDLAVSMATATPFLGTFNIPTRSRVAVVSGESGEYTLKETCLRVLGARGLPDSATDDWLKWDFTLPSFTDLDAVAEFAADLTAMEVTSSILDPVYLGLPGIDMKNMFEAGPAFRLITEILLRAGITPIFVHHANRLLTVGEPMELQHLAYSGLEQFTRQFLLINRREAYRSDGRHDLWLRVGGSAGHGGLWAVHVEEGLQNEEFTGRKWEVTVQTTGDVNSGDAARKEAAKRERARQAREEEDRQVLEAVDAEVRGGQAGATKKSIRDRHPHLSDTKVSEITGRLVEREILEKHDFEKKGGKGSTQTVSGFRRPPSDDDY